MSGIFLDVIVGLKLPVVGLKLPCISSASIYWRFLTSHWSIMVTLVSSVFNLLL